MSPPLTHSSSLQLSRRHGEIASDRALYLLRVTLTCHLTNRIKRPVMAHAKSHKIAGE